MGGNWVVWFQKEAGGQLAYFLGGAGAIFPVLSLSPMLTAKLNLAGLVSAEAPPCWLSWDLTPTQLLQHLKHFLHKQPALPALHALENYRVQQTDPRQAASGLCVLWDFWRVALDSAPAQARIYINLVTTTLPTLVTPRPCLTQFAYCTRLCQWLNLKGASRWQPASGYPGILWSYPRPDTGGRHPRFAAWPLPQASKVSRGSEAIDPFVGIKKYKLVVTQ